MRKKNGVSAIHTSLFRHIHIYGFHKPVNSISVPVLSHLRSWHLSLENMYIYMSNSKLKLTCHKLSPMAAHWRQGQSFFFLLAELPLSLASVNRCENRIAFTLDILIPRCAFLMFPSLCVLRLFHRICTPNLFMLLLSFRPSFNGYLHDICSSLVYLI